jgi:hypothetical protein
VKPVFRDEPKGSCLHLKQDGPNLAEIILSQREDQQAQKPKPTPSKNPGQKNARVAIVIDDLGEDYDLAMDVVRIPGLPAGATVLKRERGGQQLEAMRESFSFSVRARLIARAESFNKDVAATPAPAIFRKSRRFILLI